MARTVEAWLAILELTPPCDKKEINQARKRLALKLHPDRAESEADRDSATRRMQAVNAAADSLLEHVGSYGPIGASSQRQQSGNTRSSSGAGHAGRYYRTSDSPPRKGSSGQTSSHARTGQQQGRRARNRREEQKRRDDNEYSRNEYEKYREKRFGKKGSGEGGQAPSQEATRLFNRFRMRRTELLQALEEFDLRTRQLKHLTELLASTTLADADLWKIYSAFFESYDAEDVVQSAQWTVERIWSKQGHLLRDSGLVMFRDYLSFIQDSGSRVDSHIRMRVRAMQDIKPALDHFTDALVGKSAGGRAGRTSNTIGAVLHLREVLGIASDLDNRLVASLDATEGFELRLRIGRVTNVVQQRGFAFVREISSGNEVFVHASAINEGDFSGITQRSLLLFRIRKTSKGLQAFDVQLAPGS